jgi:hypothetical protein
LGFLRDAVANWEKHGEAAITQLRLTDPMRYFLSAVRLAGDISGKMDDVSLDELLVTIRQEWAKLGPLIDLEAVEAPPG